MVRLIDQILERIPQDDFTDTELLSILQKSKNSYYGLIKRGTACGDLIRIKRGLYLLAKKFRRRPLGLYEISQKIYGPSYVSFESALAFHGWIPEAVHIVSCASIKRSARFATPLGNFVYTHVPVRCFFSGVELTQKKDETFYMAKPLKALADLVFATKKNWLGFRPLVESLRIERENLEVISPEEFDEMEPVYKNERVLRFLLSLKKELGYEYRNRSTKAENLSVPNKHPRRTGA